MHTIVGDTIAGLARKSIDAIVRHGETVERYVGGWALQKPGKHRVKELHNVLLMLENPIARWNSRVNLGILTEVMDYFLGLNPGFAHNAWSFYDQWRQVGGDKYPYTYGERIYGTSDQISQWTEVVKKLRREATTRHACVVMWRPIDQLRDFVPCTFDWMFQTDSSARLEMTTLMRSQDALRGLFLDLFAYTHFHEQMALSCNLKLSRYYQFQTNIHIYEKDMDKIDSLGRPQDPYKHVRPSRAELLSDNDKRNLFYCQRAIFDRPDFDIAPSLEKLPQYWRDWMLFQLVSRKQIANQSQADVIETPEIRWLLERQLHNRKAKTKTGNRNRGD